MMTSYTHKTVFHVFVPKSIELCLSCFTNSEPSTPSFNIRQHGPFEKPKGVGAQRAWKINIHLLVLSQGHFSPGAYFGMLSF